eukprot:CAMPEP_0115633468 /NCGR_PEP_ID=MMETSP0272-20121206/32067_1 /TAXON_ID=71861 /ORGANISM="Scrippsiella trochoidea, Strain CCMP3099" /LENGTH=147 /DNA_ID=CAMNT_0003070239 /DNA_START=29 /DNA_END=470 /DNA_ORIENTATION=-
MPQAWPPTVQSIKVTRFPFAGADKCLVDVLRQDHGGVAGPRWWRSPATDVAAAAAHGGGRGHSRGFEGGQRAVKFLEALRAHPGLQACPDALDAVADTHAVLPPVVHRAGAPAAAASEIWHTDAQASVQASQPLQPGTRRRPRGLAA